MTDCNRCGGRMTVGPSAFPGFDLLKCEPCDRPVKLIIRKPPSHHRPGRKGDRNRMLRAARRAKLKGIRLP